MWSGGYEISLDAVPALVPGAEACEWLEGQGVGRGCERGTDSFWWREVDGIFMCWKSVNTAVELMKISCMLRGKMDERGRCDGMKCRSGRVLAFFYFVGIWPMTGGPC